MIQYLRNAALLTCWVASACNTSETRDHYWNSSQCAVSHSGGLPFEPTYCEAYLHRIEGGNVLVLHLDDQNVGIGNADPAGSVLRILLAPEQRAKKDVRLSVRGTAFPGANQLTAGNAQLLHANAATSPANFSWSSARGTLRVVSYSLKERDSGENQLVDLDIVLDLSRAVVEPAGDKDAAEIALSSTIRVRAVHKGAKVPDLPAPNPPATDDDDDDELDDSTTDDTDVTGDDTTSAGDAIDGGANETTEDPLDPTDETTGNDCANCGTPGCNVLGACNGEQVYTQNTVALCEDADTVGILGAGGELAKVDAASATANVVFTGPGVDQTARCSLSGADAYATTSNGIFWADPAALVSVHPYGRMLGATASTGYLAADNGSLLELQRFAKPHETTEVIGCATRGSGSGVVTPEGVIYMAEGNQLVRYDVATPVVCGAVIAGTSVAQAAMQVQTVVYAAGRLVFADGMATTFDVIEVDEASATATSLGTASTFNAYPLAVKDDATFFAQPTVSLDSHLIVEARGGTIRPLGVAVGAVSGIAATDSHVYWSLLQGGVFRAPR